MLVYSLTLILAVFFTSLSEKFKEFKKLFFFLTLFVLVFVQGFRDVSVGTDTSAYVRFFESEEHFLLDLFYSTSSLEIGYRFIQTLAYQLSNEYYVLLFLIALISVYFQLKTIYKISVNSSISIFVFITFCIYTFTFNGFRQGLAASIYVFAFVALVKGNFKRYCLWVGVAFLFHKTVIFALPMYFIFRLKFNLKLFFLMFLSSIIIVLFFDKVLSFSILLSDKYEVYQELNATGGQLLSLFYFIESLFFLVCRPFIKREYTKSYDIFLNMFLVATIIYIIVLVTGVYIELTRLAFYFLGSSMFLWPMIFKSCTKKHILLLYMGFGISHVLYFYVFLSKMGSLSPYFFNSKLINSF
jgi:transmembrane protein EpsG